MSFIHIGYRRHDSWFNYLRKYVDGYRLIYPPEKKFIVDQMKSSSKWFIEHLKGYRPDVVFVQSAINYNAKFIRNLRQTIPDTKIIGHHNSKGYSKAFREYDTLFVGMNSTREEFIKDGVNARLIDNAYDPEMGDNLRDLPLIHNVLCSGSLILKRGYHRKRMRCIVAMIKAGIPIQLDARLDKYRRYPKAIMRLNTEPTSGKLYRQIIKSHPIVFNCHADLATEATNMRMFEVCGIGSLLITDHLPGIERLFTPGKEVLTYVNESELIYHVKWALNNSHEARKIAEAGKRRVFREHLVKHRANQFQPKQ